MSEPTPLQAATAVREAAAQLVGVQWDQVEDADLCAVADALAAVKAVAEGALVEVADRLEATDAAAAHGWASAKDFLTHLLGGHKGAGGSLVRAAAQTRNLPDVRAALTTGEVSLAQARVIGQRVATLPRVAELREQAAALMLARVGDHGYDATDLDRTFPGVVKELDPDGSLLAQDRNKPSAERGAHLARFLSFARDALGGVRIKGYATLEEAEIVKATLMPLAKPVTTEPGACGGDPTQFKGARDHNGRPTNPNCPDPVCGHDGRDPRDHGTRMWDALVEACTRLQATDNLPHTHGSTARIIVTISDQALRDELGGQGLLPDGDTLSATAVRRLACNAEIIPGVLGTKGEILDLGRAQRLVTAGLFLALVLRDQHCAFPGCTRPPIACDAHHITHWADGGTTSLDNLVLLCRRHHTITHHTPWTVHIDPHTRRPVWRPPPRIDDRDRFTYIPARPRPPLAA
jgi:hypothetical protein